MTKHTVIIVVSVIVALAIINRVAILAPVSGLVKKVTG